MEQRVAAVTMNLDARRKRKRTAALGVTLLIGGAAGPFSTRTAAEPGAEPQVAKASPAASTPTPTLVAAPPVVDASLAAATETSIAAGIAAIRRAAAQPGRLDRENWELGKTLLPEAILNRVKSGEYAYKLVDVDSETLKQGYSKPFWEASAANAGKYDIAPNTCGLKDVATGTVPDFYFGYPFPEIDPRDPQAACKMAWNFEATNAMGEGHEETITMSGVDSSGEFTRVKLQSRWVSYQGRHGGPIENPEGLRSASRSSLIEPQDVDDGRGLTKRINDWSSQDKGWFFSPSMRHVRRVNAAAGSAMTGTGLFADDVNCFGGKIEHFRWQLIGDGVVLAPLLSSQPLPLEGTDSPTRFAVTLPTLHAAYETPGATGVPWLIVDNLMFTPRPVWIIEGWSDDPYYNFGKVIMYMDKDLYRIYWKLVHNRAGEYFYNAMCASYTARDAESTFSAVNQALILGVNDRANRAGLMRVSSAFIERNVEDEHYTLRYLMHMSD